MSIIWDLKTKVYGTMNCPIATFIKPLAKLKENVFKNVAERSQSYLALEAWR